VRDDREGAAAGDFLGGRHGETVNATGGGREREDFIWRASYRAVPLQAEDIPNF
jgi:hypothetical protein